MKIKKFLGQLIFHQKYQQKWKSPNLCRCDACLLVPKSKWSLCNSPLIHRFLPMTHKRFSSIWILVWYCLDSDICANLRQLFFSNIEHTDETFPLGFDPPQITGLPLKSEPEVELVKDWVAKSRYLFWKFCNISPIWGNITQPFHQIITTKINPSHFN